MYRFWLIIVYYLGVYKDFKSYPLYIDIGQVAEFQSITDNIDSIEFGASVTLNRLANFLALKSDQSVTFNPISSHIKQVASKPIRNVS